MLFNLRIDGSFSQALSWCPFDNLQPVSKVLLKSSFIFYLFVLVLITLTLLKISRKLKMIPSEHVEASNSYRLVLCTLRLILISYAGITTACFSLLSCVGYRNQEKILFIDGSIKCYTWWQKVVLFVVFCWIFPFPVAICTTSNLLHNNIPPFRRLFCCLLFPMPTICYWLYICILHSQKDGRELRASSVMSQTSKEAMNILEGPFRKRNCTEVSKQHPLPWESILIGRRLVLILIKAFIINTSVRLFF